MTVGRSMRELRAAWVAAAGPATGLERALSQDYPGKQPDEEAPAPIGGLIDPAQEVLALLAAGAARLDAAAGDDARDVVAFVQDRRLELGEHVARLARVDAMLDLRAFARRRDRDAGSFTWLAWWGTVLRSLNEFLATLGPLDEALAGCWRELTERLRPLSAVPRTGDE